MPTVQKDIIKNGVVVGQQSIDSEPTHKTSMDTNDFLWLFTGSELRAINALSETDDDVYKLWNVVTNTNNGVSMSNPNMVTGLALLVVRGVLTQSRHDVIIAGKEL